jgi:hypothetical protein
MLTPMKQKACAPPAESRSPLTTMTRTNTESTVVKDNDCHTYRIPLELEERFGVMLAAITAAEYQSDDWYDANDALDSEFHQYMFSGK